MESIKLAITDLSCLKLYNMYVVAGVEQSRRTIFKSNGKDIILYQCGGDVNLFTVLADKNPDEKVFEFMFQTDQLYKLISLSTLDTVELSPDTVKFSESSIYNLTDQEVAVHDIDINKFIGIYDNRGSYPTVTLKDLDKLASISQYTSTQEKLNTIGLFEGYFVGTDRYNMTAAVKTGITADTDYYFPLSLMKLFNQLKDNEITLYQVEEVSSYMVALGDTFIFAEYEPEYILPNIFQPDYRAFYDHPFTVSVKKLDILHAVKKLLVVTNSAFSNRVFITVDKDSLILECKDSHQAIERIPALVDANIIGHKFILSSLLINSTISNLEQEDIQFKLPADISELKVVLVKDSTEDKLYIHHVYVNLEVE